MNTLSKSLAVLASLGLAALAPAHFLWSFTDTSGTQCHFQFCESPGDSVLPLMASLEPKLTFASPDSKPVRTTDTRFSVVQAEGRPTAAKLVYGVTEREGEVFLLNYYTKATPNASAAAEPSFKGTNIGSTYEIIAERTDGKVRLTALFNGKKVSSQFIQVTAPGSEVELQNNADGTAFAESIPDSPLMVRARYIEPDKSGELNGEKYDLTKHYATLTVGTAAVKEAAAYEMLKAASEKRYNLPADLTAVEGTVEYTTASGKSTANFAYDTPEGFFMKSFDGGDAEKDEVTRILTSIFMHRSSRDFDQGDGRHPLTFTGNDNLIGTQIALNDRLNSTYRVQDDQVVEVDRVMGGARFVINVLENTTTPDGKFLPKVYNVVRYKPNSTEIESVQYVTDTYAQVNGVWLPSVREVTYFKGESIEKTRLVFSNLKITR